MNLQITHETRYDYEPAVEVAQHICHLQPIQNATQGLLAHALEISPPPADISRALDTYGNTRFFFSLHTSHDHLLVVAKSLIATTAPATAQSSLAWEQVRDRFRYSAGQSYDAAAEFVFASPHVPRHPEFAAFARPSFLPHTPLLQATKDLMLRIHTEFIYESQSTQVNTPALEALAQRKGVCQDFAHIMIACLRALGLPARYVSGYLLTEPPPGEARLVGSDASHAWVSVYIPDLPTGLKWCDFDPTNNRFGLGSPGEDYVTLALGRDFADVSPVRGVIQGGTHHTLAVAVTVEPVCLPSPGQIQWQHQSQGQSQSQSQGQLLN